ncbi:MAG: hypothetical protein ABR574_12825 [Cryomorphaceae bacterium]
MKTSSHEYKEYRESRNYNFWGAVFAGFLTALSIVLLLNLLGLGIGFATINPLEESNPMEGLGIGSIIWWSVSNLVALFAGGIVAGRLSGPSANEVGGLYGFTAWGIYALVSVWLVFSGVGSIIGGVTGTAANLLSGSQKDVSVNINDKREQGKKETGASMASVKSDIRNVVQMGERLEILPEDASTEVNKVLDTGRKDVEKVMRDLNVDENIDEFFNDLTFNLDDEGNLDIKVKGDGEYFNKVDLKEYLAENTELTEAEIDGMIEKWEKKIDQAVQKAEELYRKAKQELEEAAAKTADAIAKFSIWAFLALLLGAGAAFFGGTIGNQENHIKAEVVDTTEERTDVR